MKKSAAFISILSSGLILILILILILTLRFVYRVPPAFAGSAMPVKVIYAKRTTAAKNITSLGKVKSNGRQVFTAPFTGRLIESFSFPRFVNPGTVIARIVNPGLYAKIISAKARVRYAEIKLKREKLLFGYGVAAKKTLEQAVLSLADASSALRSLESVGREGALISRFDGTVHYLRADGSIVSAGSSVAVLNGKGMPWIRTYVTPSQSFNLYNNMRVVIKKGRIKEEGRIISIGGNAGHNGLVPVYISLPENSSLLPGEWVNLSFAVSKTAAFSLPVNALVMLKGGTFVFTVVHNKAQAVKVKVMEQKNDTADVKGAIKAGEPVIVYPVTRLITGIAVEIKH
ncbi:MAG: efflux RND transporter periplasmic adaptor subunit [Deltaproteobacteria bacterium]|jgi:multidrug efflux pump subunit AcrA (membrane-fusion protein)|nr:efflux RND transporter periplasmic adaptor subunit [Deltaproteobacteria bacterium]